MAGKRKNGEPAKAPPLAVSLLRVSADLAEGEADLLARVVERRSADGYTVRGARIASFEDWLRFQLLREATALGIARSEVEVGLLDGEQPREAVLYFNPIGRRATFTRERIEPLLRAGLTTSEVAGALGCSVSLVQLRMKQWGLPRPKARRGTIDPALQARRRGSPKGILGITRDQLRKAISIGRTTRRAAELLGCSKTTAHRLAHRYGVSLPQHGGVRPHEARPSARRSA